MLTNARNSYFILSLTLSFSLRAALPELSSIEPLQFDEDSQRLVARGDARLEFDDTRIQADRITYYQDYMLADANGNVTITQEGQRLLADRISFDVSGNVFSVDKLRTGKWPYYISGLSGGGTIEDSTVEESKLYYGNPGPFSLNINAKKVQYTSDNLGQSISLDGATLRLGDMPFFYLPSYSHRLGENIGMVDFNIGSDSSLGQYLQTTTLFPLNSWLRVGANIDYYSERGILAGPTSQYVYHSPTQSIRGALTTGYINDKGDASELKFDNLNRPIEQNRGFAEWRHKHTQGERFAATASLSYWEDSEVTRDFRDDIFNENQRPDTFFEAAYSGENFILSAFSRFRPNDFQLIQERLPEIRFDLLPSEILDTGIYHRTSASYVQLRENFDGNIPLPDIEKKSERVDLTYRVERLFNLKDWLTLTPLAGARLSNYSDQKINDLAVKKKYSREIFELGFDLQARAYASYPTINETWGVDGLRHIVRPVARYRYYSDPDDINEIAAIDRKVFDLNRPLLDLSDLRNIDDISDTHLVRLGVETLFQTRAKDYGSRNMAALNLYQDILFKKNLGSDRPKQDTFNATWVELVLSPAPWLKFDLASRFHTERLALQELRTRTALKSGGVWELGLSTDLLNEHINQYRLDFIYRINERHDFLTDLNFDAEKGDIIRARLGVRTRVGSTWELLYALTFRENARRESDFSFDIQMHLADNN